MEEISNRRNGHSHHSPVYPMLFCCKSIIAAMIMLCKCDDDKQHIISCEVNDIDWRYFLAVTITSAGESRA